VATFHEQDCPLCDKPAKYGEVDIGNAKYFDCPHCGMFQISTGAEKRLKEELPDRKVLYAAQVKQTPEEYLLFIRLPAHEFRQKSDDRLQAEYVPKSQLNLIYR
jgi:hypothetical protein